eukprot:scaffold2.g6978.t1
MAAEPNLDAAYAGLQANLRKGYLADLEELKQMLLNTIALQPERAAKMQPKLQQLDVAIALFQARRAPHAACGLWLCGRFAARREERKAGVTTADMSRLMNMSAKVGKAVEAFRAHKQLRQGVPVGAQGGAAAAATAQAHMLSVNVAHSTAGAYVSLSSASPFQQLQSGLNGTAVVAGAAGSMPPSAAPQQVLMLPAQLPAGSDSGGTPAQQAAQAAGINLAVLENMDNFDFLAALVGTDSATLTASELVELPSIDWEVPEVRPSGNLDSLLASEASEVLRQQQLATETARRRALRSASSAGGLQGPTEAEAWLARVANAQRQAAAPGGGVLHHTGSAPSVLYAPALAPAPAWDAPPGVGSAPSNGVAPPGAGSAPSNGVAPPGGGAAPGGRRRQLVQHQSLPVQPLRPRSPLAAASVRSDGSGGGSVSMMSIQQQQQDGGVGAGETGQRTPRRRSHEQFAAGGAPLLPQQEGLRGPGSASPPVGPMSPRPPPGGAVTQSLVVQQQAVLLHLQHLQQQQAAAQAAGLTGPGAARFQQQAQQLQLLQQAQAQQAAAAVAAQQQQHLLSACGTPRSLQASAMASPTYALQAASHGVGAASDMDWQSGGAPLVQGLQGLQQGRGGGMVPLSSLQPGGSAFPVIGALQAIREGRLPGGDPGGGNAPPQPHPSLVLTMDGTITDSGALPFSASGYMQLARDLQPAGRLGGGPGGGPHPGAGEAAPASSRGSKRSKHFPK